MVTEHFVPPQQNVVPPQTNSGYTPG